jgi:DNA-binding winged helix-turn-helix (wHTH) protein
VLQAGNLTIDLQKRLLWRGEDKVHLSPTEFDLLAFMMKHPGSPLTHVKLLRTIWGPEYGGELEYLRTYVRMLRRKIENEPARPDYILTEPRVGYRFRNPANPDLGSVATDETPVSFLIGLRLVLESLRGFKQCTHLRPDARARDGRHGHCLLHPDAPNRRADEGPLARRIPPPADHKSRAPAPRPAWWKVGRGHARGLDERPPRRHVAR